MQNRFSSWCRRTMPVLFKDTMPVWLTLVASIAASIVAGGGAYWLSPIINRQFEIDGARSAHVAKTTEDLNHEIIELSQKVRRLNDALVNQPDAAPALRQDCLDLVTKLQWMLVDLRVVLKAEDDRQAVASLARALTGVKFALDRAIDARARPQLVDAMRALGAHTHDVLNRLYVAASLK